MNIHNVTFSKKTTFPKVSTDIDFSGWRNLFLPNKSYLLIQKYYLKIHESIWIVRQHQPKIILTVQVQINTNVCKSTQHPKMWAYPLPQLQLQTNSFNPKQVPSANMNPPWPCFFNKCSSQASIRIKYSPELFPYCIRNTGSTDINHVSFPPLRKVQPCFDQ